MNATAYNTTTTRHPLASAVAEIAQIEKRDGNISLLDAQLIYAKHGIPTFPVNPANKRPIISTGKDHAENASSDPIVIRGWRAKWSNAGIGMPTGKATKTVVMDLDVRTDKNGLDGFRELCRWRGGFPNTLQASTPSGGKHLYLLHPGAGIRVKSSTGVCDLQGVDSRADGGMVLLPPSMGKENKRYSWFDPETQPDVQSMPDWLLPMIQGGNSEVKGSTIYNQQNISEGNRNSHLFKLACKWRGEGYPETQIIDWLKMENAQQCVPPLSFSEIEIIAKSASRYSAGSKQTSHPPATYQKAAIRSWTAKELLEADFPEPNWAVRDLIPEGLTLLVGKSKVGKSWASLDIALAVASGKKALGGFSTEQGAVLYLALEDNARRLQSRLLLSGAEDREGIENLHFTTDWPKLDEGGLEKLEDEIKSLHPRLVIVDVLQRIRPASRRFQGNQYEEDYKVLEGLKRLTDESGLSILVVHHSRKAGSLDDPFDVINGTMGLSAALDNAIILEMGSGQSDRKLYVRGRDVEEKKFALTFDPSKKGWEVVGGLEMFSLTPEQKEVLGVIQQAGEAIGPNRIAEALNKTSESVRQLLAKMLNAGVIKKAAHGKYVPGDNSNHNAHNSNPPICGEAA